MTDFEMKPVDSSNVDSVGYDVSTQTLRVRFRSGSVYEYKGVGVMEYNQLMNAPSVGSYLNRNVKGAYPYERVE